MSHASRKVPAGKSAETVRKYMDEAEKLFIQLGYDATSIRAISAQAQMNLATVVYHWGTKEALFHDVCLRRFADIHAEQVRRLSLCKAAKAELSPADLTDILRALVEPPLLLQADPHVAERTRHLYGRVLTDPSPVALKVTSDIFGEGTELFRALVRQCLWHLDEETFHWRYVCAVGAFVIAQSFEPKFTQALDLSRRTTDWSFAADQIVRAMASSLIHE